MIDIKSLTVEEIAQSIKEYDMQAFRAKQIFKWLHEKSVESFDEMLNIPKSIRVKLADLYYISVAFIEKKQISCYDSTVKYLFRLNDGEYIEAVLMKYHFGYTLCVSTQVGCRMGCTFCATGQNGFTRHLTPSEMIAQIQTTQKDNDIRISNIVLMGMGEPLDNYDNVLKFFKLISSADGLNIGMRHITLSTCGVVDKIYKLADEKLQITLSISLHAPTNKLRKQTMPINNRFPVEELINACKYYFKTTGRRVSFEYAMINGLNDSDKCAMELVSLLKGMLCHINLIPVNETKGATYVKTDPKNVVRFCKLLEQNGITATVRRTLGSDIDASCGQLRGKKLQETQKS